LSIAAPDTGVADSVDPTGPLSDHLFALLQSDIRTSPAPDTAAPPPRYRRFLDALGVAVYTADSDGRITYFNDAAAAFWGRRPEIGEEWCGSWRLFWSDGRPMRHEECPMAIALRENRAVRGYEAMAERPDGSRVSFVPYPTPLHDESGRLIGAVNVLVDITERRQAEDALRAAAQALSASNTVKDEFLGLISHELRTPVTTIFGNARLLRDRAGRLSDADRESMIGDIWSDSERLLAIIENLLLLTRLESGSSIELEPQVLERVARKVVDAHRDAHPDRRITLRATPMHAIVEADAGYLELLLGNLLTNAAKYSPPGKPIEVVVRARKDHAEVIVRDRGIGFAHDEIPKLFSAFYRGDEARHMGNGVGIGLTVCRRLVASLGGRIWAAPRKGGGSEFGFSVPLMVER
jgi:PAS domain S-box-containing protein